MVKISQEQTSLLTTNPRALAQCDKVDHIVFHLQHCGRLSVNHCYARRPACLVVRQAAREYHIRLSANRKSFSSYKSLETMVFISLLDRWFSPEPLHNQ